MIRLPGRSVRDSYRIRVSRRERLARAREHRAELWPADPPPCLYPTREADPMADQTDDHPNPLIPARPPRPPHRPG